MEENKDYLRKLEIEYQKYVYTMNIESFKALLESGKNAMNASMIINSGASISVLTFITKLMSEGDIELAKNLSLYLSLFACGVFFTALAYAITYFTQIFNYKFVSTREQKYETRGKLVNIVAIVLVVISFFLFAYSSISFYCFIQSYQVG